MTEKSRLHFAATTLAVVSFMFLAGMYCYYNDEAGDAGGGAGKAIFDTCKTVLPPIATLVLGYYFGQPRTQESSSRQIDRGNHEPD
jgi:hypothetical protein